MSSVSVRSTAEDHLSTNAHADRVLVVKSAGTLTLLNHDHVVKVYKVSLGGDPIGPKTRRGDPKTREGI